MEKIKVYSLSYTNNGDGDFTDVRLFNTIEEARSTMEKEYEDVKGEIDEGDIENYVCYLEENECGIKGGYRDVLNEWQITEHEVDVPYRRKSGKEIASELSDMLNNMCNQKDIEMFYDYVLHDHRTLQQSFFGLLLKGIEKFSEVEHYDGRNEYAVKTAKKLKAFMDENYIGGGCPLV